LKVIEVPLLHIVLSIFDVVHFRYHLMWQDLRVVKLSKLLWLGNVASTVSFVSMMIVICKMCMLTELTFMVTMCNIRVIKSIVLTIVDMFVALVTIQIWLRANNVLVVQ